MTHAVCLCKTFDVCSSRSCFLNCDADDAQWFQVKLAKEIVERNSRGAPIHEVPAPLATLAGMRSPPESAASTATMIAPEGERLADCGPRYAIKYYNCCWQGDRPKHAGF